MHVRAYFAVLYSFNFVASLVFSREFQKYHSFLKFMACHVLYAAKEKKPPTLFVDYNKDQF